MGNADSVLLDANELARFAVEWLERAYEDHSQWLMWIKVWPQFDSLRGEPRFQELLRRMGLG